MRCIYTVTCTNIFVWLIYRNNLLGLDYLLLCLWILATTGFTELITVTRKSHIVVACSKFYYITWYVLTLTEIDILWAHHQVHHSSDDFSMSVGVRHGIFNNWLSWVGFVKINIQSLLSPFDFCHVRRFYILPLLFSSHHLSSFSIYKSACSIKFGSTRKL